MPMFSPTLAVLTFLADLPGAAPVMRDSLADYPRWFVVGCVTLVAAVAIWILVKALKWALWFLLGAVVIVGGGAVVWLLLK